MNILEWIIENPNLLLFFVTLIYVIITFKYMIATRRMANTLKEESEIMKKEFNIKMRPLVKISVSVYKYGGYVGTIKIRILNYGFFPIILDRFIYSYWPIENPRDRVNEVKEYSLPIKVDDGKELKVTIDYGDNPNLREYGEIHNNFHTGYYFYLLDVNEKKIRRPAAGEKIIKW